MREYNLYTLTAAIICILCSMMVGVYGEPLSKDDCGGGSVYNSYHVFYIYAIINGIMVSQYLLYRIRRHKYIRYILYGLFCILFVSAIPLFAYISHSDNNACFDHFDSHGIHIYQITLFLVFVESLTVIVGLLAAIVKWAYQNSNESLEVEDVLLVSTS